ncbi:MAG: phosphatidylglycerophosphatase A [Pseudomonadota bacterium]
MSFLVATFFYTGCLRPAPGTWGSLAAVVTGLGLVSLGGWLALAIGVVLAFGLGMWATHHQTQGSDDHDPSEIVIDEVAGQWIALGPVAIGAAHAGVSIFALWPGIICAFVLFRLFDIWKPGPVGWADRQQGPLGVMLDDVIAGGLAALGVLALAWLAHSGILSTITE